MYMALHSTDSFANYLRTSPQKFFVIEHWEKSHIIAYISQYRYTVHKCQCLSIDDHGLMANDWGADRLNLSRDEYISMHLYPVVAALNDENHETEKKSSLKSKTDTQFFFLEIRTVTNTKQIRKIVVIGKLRRPFIINPWNKQCYPVNTLSTFLKTVTSDYPYLAPEGTTCCICGLKIWFQLYLAISCSSSHGPLIRYAKLQVAHAPVYRERFPRHRELAIPTCIRTRAWRTYRDACRDR